MKTILVINRPQIEAYWTLPFLFLKIQTNYNKVLEAEDKYWQKEKRRLHKEYYGFRYIRSYISCKRSSI